ncbi:MAG: asparagine synthase-related protein [Ruminococcus sp.]|nr:asparagine synthase-related protein [Ruminococcus sp.]
MENSIQIRYFSGYIRNYKSLCAELGIDAGLSREAREEAILKKAYAEWKLDMMSHLYGMFAIALWDDDEQKLFVIRDQVGQKQMFYTVCGNELLCDGDINKIVADPRVEKKLNRRMLQLYLFYGYPIGEETFYEGVYKLMPGHYVEWDGKSAEAHRYFCPEFTPDYSKNAQEWAKEIEKVVEEILDEERGDSEIPYKESFLSGGVDSSYLLAAGDAQCANTVGYDEEGFNESGLARHTAEVLGKEFRVKTIRPGEYFDRIPTVIEKMGQPLGDASAVAFSLGCQAVREHAKVVYSGEGIDEFFGGYMAHRRHIPEDWTYLTCSHIMTDEYIKSLLLDYDPEINPADPVAPLWKQLKGQNELAQKLTMDISFWLEGDIYLNTDRTSTACDVELHTPFSDLRLFKVAAKIPSEYEFEGEQNKMVFRMAAASKLPDEVAFRKKVGFPVPVRQWLLDEKYNKPIADKLFGESSKKFFDQDEIKKLWTDYLDSNPLLWNRVYAIYVFLIWYDINF